MKVERIKQTIVVLFAVFIMLFAACAALEVDKATSQKDQRMAWWREAKFGMFIHWGLYAIPAGVWKGEQIDGIGEWIMARADIPHKDYEKLAPRFNPRRFDAAQWVRIAKDAGMKYIVITSKHHDGFSMFDSKVTDYDIVDATPYGKDVLKPLSRECKKAGIKFCTYYSILDWHHPSQEPNYHKQETDEDSDEGWDKYGMNHMKEGRKEEYIRYMKAQLREIITNYDPAVLWFDGGWTNWWTPSDGQVIMDFLWSLKPELIINNRAAGTGQMEQVMGDYLTPEQYIPDEHKDKDWESCMTMNDTWGYKKNDHNWKPTKVLLFNLIDITSKGGNYLLNVGLTAEGLIPKPSVQRLKKIGTWLNVNGEAIYETKPWLKRKEGPTDVSFINSYEGDYEDFVEPEYSAQDILFTSKGNTLYAICLAWPEDSVIVKSLGTRKLPDIRVRRVSMLGVKAGLRWSRNQDGLVIKAPKEKPCEYAYVFKIILEK